MTPEHKALVRLCWRSMRESSHEPNGVEYQVTEKRDEFIIAIRPTEFNSLRDVARNAAFFPAFHKATGWVHVGYLHGAKKVFESVLKNYDLTDKKIKVVGHSLGGAVAVNLALLLHDWLQDRPWLNSYVSEAVGFGAPRTHYKTVAAGFITTLYKYGSDPVTLYLPFLSHSTVLKKLKAKDKKFFSFNHHLIENYAE